MVPCSFGTAAVAPGLSCLLSCSVFATRVLIDSTWKEWYPLLSGGRAPSPPELRRPGRRGRWAVLGTRLLAMMWGQEFPPGEPACRKPAGFRRWGEGSHWLSAPETQGGLGFTSPPPSSSSHWAPARRRATPPDTLLLSIRFLFSARAPLSTASPRRRAGRITWPQPLHGGPDRASHVHPRPGRGSRKRLSNPHGLAVSCFVAFITPVGWSVTRLSFR